MINARLRDSSEPPHRPTPRLVRRDAAAAAAVVAQGSATFILGNGQIMVSGPIVDRGRNDRTDTFAVVGGSGAVHRSARNDGDHGDGGRRTRFVFTFAG